MIVLLTFWTLIIRVILSDLFNLLRVEYFLSMNYQKLPTVARALIATLICGAAMAWSWRRGGFGPRRRQVTGCAHSIQDLLTNVSWPSRTCKRLTPPKLGSWSLL